MSVSVFPTGTTIYEPESSWNGFTMLTTMDGNARLVDMNGRPVKTWEGYAGFPNKILPGGRLLTSSGVRNPKHGFQDQLDLVQLDWDGNIEWSFDRLEHIADPDEKPRWMARQHHDFQRQGNPVGYYVPGLEPVTSGGNTLLLCHRNADRWDISRRRLLDDVIIEVDWHGHILWEWQCADHFEELGFNARARQSIYRHTNALNIGEGFGDWMHLNSLSALGPNRWYDAGDSRFHPDNLIWSSRQSNILAIVDKQTGAIVWKVGPNYRRGPARKLGWIIGPHLAHLIPHGLPGAGNILVFDNGGWGGYGAPNPASATGVNHAVRDYSRVLEFDPVTLGIVWQYTAAEAGFITPIYGSRFYSSIVSGAQRLPNGNTLITEGVGGRVFEVTPDHRLVWEFVNPWSGKLGNLVYRAYRVPYDWVPQAGQPEQIPVPRLDVAAFRVSGQSAPVAQSAGTPASDAQFCVLPDQPASGRQDVIDG